MTVRTDSVQVVQEPTFLIWVFNIPSGVNQVLSVHITGRMKILSTCSFNESQNSLCCWQLPRLYPITVPQYNIRSPYNIRCIELLFKLKWLDKKRIIISDRDSVSYITDVYRKVLWLKHWSTA